MLEWRDLNSKISAMKIFKRFLTILGFMKRYVALGKREFKS